METLLADNTYSGKPRQILIVDDHAEVRDVLTVVLNMYGYQTVEACDGNEAREIYKANPIDLVITDIFMPEKDGLSLIEELRQYDSNAKIIAMSGIAGENFPGVLDWAKTLGAVSTFTKPFNHLIFLDIVRTALRSADKSSKNTSLINVDNNQRADAYHS